MEETSKPVAEEPNVRKFVFLELFAGLAGFSHYVKEICGSKVVTLTPLDALEGWDILSGEGLALAEQEVMKADHVHLAWPCRSLSRARREDQHGSVKVVRSEEFPRGWGDPLSEEGNQFVDISISFAHKCIDRGKTFSMENPDDSYAWDFEAMVKLLKREGVEKITLHQCAYGARSKKPTAIVSSAKWMLQVSLLCTTSSASQGWPPGQDMEPVGERLGLENVESGGISYWSMSCMGKVVESVAGYRRLLEVSSCKDSGSRQQVPVGQIGLDSAEGAKYGQPGDCRGERYDENSEKRMGESAMCWWAEGSKCEALRKAGDRIRRCLDSCITDCMLASFERKLDKDEDAVKQAQRAIAREFGVNEEDIAESGYQAAIIRNILIEAKDPDAEVLYRWATEGVPLGISRPIEHTGIFPKSNDVSAAIKASQTLGVLAEDWSGEATNYKSFQEAGDKAFSELDRLVEEDRADLVNSWEEVVQLVGPKAKLTQMACIVKIKEGVEKVRLVVDMRRSGVNGLMKLYERVCLPRIYDVARSVDELFKLSHDNDVLVFMVADFSDAFYTLRLHADERPWVVVKGRPNQYYCLKCISFGLACGPLVWARFASMCMRLSQAACLNHEARHQCYVDDPVVIASGSCHRDRSRVFFRVTLLWQVLGFKVAWHKAFRGSSVSWIGVKLSFQGSSHRDLRVELPEEKVSKILASFKEIRSHNGVFPTKLLESTVGLFSWASSIIPLARPWTALQSEQMAVPRQKKLPV